MKSDTFTKKEMESLFGGFELTPRTGAQEKPVKAVKRVKREKPQLLSKTPSSVLIKALGVRFAHTILNQLKKHWRELSIFVVAFVGGTLV